MAMMQEATEQFKRIDPADSPRWCRDRNFPCPPVRFHENSRTMKKPLGFRLASLIPTKYLPLTPSLSPSAGERVTDSSAVALAKAEGRVPGRFRSSKRDVLIWASFSLVFALLSLALSDARADLPPLIRREVLFGNPAGVSRGLSAEGGRSAWHGGNADNA